MKYFPIQRGARFLYESDILSSRGIEDNRIYLTLKRKFFEAIVARV